MALLGLFSPALRAVEPVLRDEFTAQWEQGVKQGNWQSLAVGMLRDGTSISAFFGHLDGQDGPAPNGTSRFELGAITEAYTGVLLADMAIAGKLRIDDTLKTVWPDRTFGDASLGAVSLRQIATYESHLAALPPNLFPRSDDDPLAGYDAGALDRLLAHCHCVEAAQSGVGPLPFGLLGRAIAPGDFAATLRERVLAPLEMSHTDYDDAGLVSGHALGVGASSWHYGALLGAGGLRSTLDDQLRFAQALLRPGEVPLRAALLLARQPRGDVGALGWHVMTVKSDEQEWPLLWNGGISGGHASFFGLRVDRQQAVVILGNASADVVGSGIALLTDRDPPQRPSTLRAISQDVAQGYAGIYQLAPNDEIILRGGKTGLLSQRKGEFALQLLSYGEDAFVFPGLGAQLTFQRNAAGHIEEALLTANGVTRAAQRLTQRAPALNRPVIEAKGEDIDACAGDYALSTAAQLRLSRHGDRLWWQLSGAAPAPLTSFAIDRYSTEDNDLDLRCVRDDAGHVTALVLSLAGSDLTAARVVWEPPAPVPAETKKIEPPKSAKH